MAASWNSYELAVSPQPVMWSVLVTAAALSAAIAVFLRVIERVGMWGFALYRLALAAVIILVMY